MKPMQKRFSHNRGHKHSKPSGNRFHHNQGRSTAAQRNHLQQQLEKYQNLAREASSTGDKIQAESYYQHAEHFLRTLNIIKAEDARIAEQEQAERDAKAQQEPQEQDVEEMSMSEDASSVVRDITPSDEPSQEGGEAHPQAEQKPANRRRKAPVTSDTEGESRVTPLRRRKKVVEETQAAEPQGNGQAI